MKKWSSTMLLLLFIFSLTTGCINKETGSEIDDNVIEDDLLIIVAEEGYFGPDYQWIFVLNNSTTYKVITQGARGKSKSLSGGEKKTALKLLSYANHTDEYDPPIDIMKKEIDQNVTDELFDKVVNSDFYTNHTLDGCCDAGYYFISIFLDGYEKEVRYYNGMQPNNETQELADYVLDIW